MATQGVVSATIVVEFNAAESGEMTAELDTREDGYNAGKSSFSAGDEPVILLRKSDNVILDLVICSLGTITQFATGFTSETNWLTYPRTKDANTDKIISSNFTSQWFGNNLGSVQVQGDKSVILTAAGANTSVGVLKVTYDSNFIAYKLAGIPSTVNGQKEFSVLVMFVGHTE